MYATPTASYSGHENVPLMSPTLGKWSALGPQGCALKSISSLGERLCFPGLAHSRDTEAGLLPGDMELLSQMTLTKESLKAFLDLP